jgi:hypothetical protein
MCPIEEKQWSSRQLATGWPGPDKDLPTETALKERRRARRFKVDWGVKVRGHDKQGDRFSETGSLADLSSRGALLRLTKRLRVGTKLEVLIRLPSPRKRWMAYPGEVVRCEDRIPRAGIAVRFTRIRPKLPTAATDLMKDPHEEAD